MRLRVTIRWNGDELSDQTVDNEFQYQIFHANHLGVGSVDARHPDLISVEIERLPENAKEDSDGNTSMV